MSTEAYEDLDGTLTKLADPAGDPAIPEPEPPADPTESDPAGAPAAQTPEEKAAEEHKKKTGSQRARERADRLERENQALRDALAGNRPAQAAPEASTTGKPDPNDPKWKTHEEFEQAKFDYEVERRIADRDQKNRTQAAMQTWKERDEAFTAEHEDFPEVFQDFLGSKPSETIKQSIMRSPVGPAIANHLGNNPAEIRRINALEPVEQALEIGELAARFKAPAAKKEVKPSQAPVPIKPLSGGTKQVTAPNADGRYEQY